MVDRIGKIERVLRDGLDRVRLDIVVLVGSLVEEVVFWGDEKYPVVNNVLKGVGKY